MDYSQSVLYLRNVRLDDADKYFCDVFSSEGNLVSSRAIDVKIRSKYNRY